ncbi:MAG: prepilin peptidase [Pseudobdellovibrionaceae bacterium]|jgi:prepilin signal peptidase PulO-like enzyme (type II secretory pathway)|nr:prepilin peptidase [Pseudobdellovibrionaceae bacterium]
MEQDVSLSELPAILWQEFITGGASSFLFAHDPFYASVIGFFVFIIGLILGSFSSAISYRTQRGESWIISSGNVLQDQGEVRAARSRCPTCQHILGVLDLVPVFSWLFLSGKCRYCRTPISARYPLAELVSGVIFLGYYFLSGYDQSLALNSLFALCLPFFVAWVFGGVVQVFLNKPSKNIMFPIRTAPSLWILGLLSFAAMLFLMRI